MLPIKAYVVEAYYNWIVDSDRTPYLLVDTTVDYLEVPKDYIQDGQIVLNMAPKAIRDLKFHPSYLSFRTQFSGVTHTIYVPMLAVMSIYAKEEGEGKIFDASEEEYDHPAMQPMPRSHFEDGGGANGAPFLYVVE